MPAYNFQARFAGDVESGKKKQTIRARRADGRAPRPGQLFVGYTGMRTKACRQLVTSTITKVQVIRIAAGVYVDGSCLLSEQTRRLAVADGFANEFDMLEWFRKTHGPLFDGHIIYWR